MQMDHWSGVGVENECYNIYRGWDLVEGGHLESKQKSDPLLRVVSYIPVLDNMDIPRDILEKEVMYSLVSV